MPPPTTAVLFSASTPPADPGNQLCTPQTDGGQPAQMISFQPQLAIAGPGGLAGVVKPDGTSITQDADGTIHAVVTGGTGGGGGGGASASGGAEVVVVPSGAKDGSNTQYTLPAPVLAGNAPKYVRNGVTQRQLGTKAEFAVQGTQLTTSTPLLSDDWHEFYYVQGTPNSESGGGGSVTPAVIRGSSAIATGPSGASSLAVPFPAGSLAGDMAVLFCANGGGNCNGGSPPMPSGWTVIVVGGQAGNAISWCGFAAFKVLTSTDISAGSVTVSIVNPFGLSTGVAGMVTFVGATSGIREGNVNPLGSGVANPDVLSTSSAVLNGEMGVFFGASGVPPGTTGVVASISPGSMLQTENTTLATAILALATMPGGVSNITFTRTGTLQNGADFLVIVKP